MELPYDPGIPLLDRYAQQLKAGTQKDTCTPTFTALLFTKPKGTNNPTVHQWMNEHNMVYTYDEYYSALK